MTVMEKFHEDTTKTGNQDRVNILLVVLALKNYSSKSNPLTYKQIAEYINEFYKRHPASISESAVRRILAELFIEQEELFPKPGEDSRSEYDNPSNLNFYIKRIQDGRTPKFYYTSNFTTGEIRFMADILRSTYKYDSEGVHRLLHKVSRLTPQDEDLYELCHNPEEMMGDITFFEHIEILSGLIKEKKYASIIYEKYDNDLKEADLQPKIYLPIEMLMLHGHYYCRAVSEDGISLLRIDRIGLVDEEDAETIPESVKSEIQKIAAKHGKDPVSKHEYEITHYVAKEGKVRKKPIELLVRTSDGSEIMNDIVDAFGENLHVEHCDEKCVVEKLGYMPEPLDDNNNETWVSISIRNTQEGAVAFATRHCDEVAIISPTDIRKALERKLRVAVNLQMS